MSGVMATASRVIQVVAARRASIALACSILLLGTVALTNRHRANTFAVQLAETDGKLRENVLLTRHLIHHLKAQSLDGLFLVGTDGVTDSVATITSARDGVYVLTSADCQWTPLNYAALRRIAAAGVLVVGLAIEGDPVVLRRHLETERPGFLVIRSPTGALVDAIPKYGTPFLIVVREGRITQMKAGLLDSADVGDILNAVHQRR